MEPSEKALALIRQFESLQLEAYPDPGLGWKLPTIGYGHTTGVKQGDVITVGQAEEFLRCDAGNAARELDAWLDSDVNVTQNEFDALVSFVFNLGFYAFIGSTLARKLMGGDKEGAAAEFPKWCHAGPQVLPGLVARRRAEMDLFLDKETSV